MNYYEAGLIDTKEGVQCKVYANSHPKGFVIVKPKYIPEELVAFNGLKKRFIFSKCVTRFNLFKDKNIVKENLARLREKFPELIYECEKHKNWFFVVPENEISKVYDAKKGLKELLKVPEKDMDDYLKAVRGIIELILKSGVDVDNLGISHSTLLGNYTPGKSDIDIIVFGKNNSWKVINYMKEAQDEKLRWKFDEEWRAYYQKRVVSKIYNEEEYVFNMMRKRDDGFYAGNVFSIFCVENQDEFWYNWNDEHEPLGAVKMRGKVKDAYNSIVRPGFYEMEETKIIEGNLDVPIKRIVTWSRPFVLQAQEGEQVEACGLLEKVKTSSREEYYQLVIGYMDTYTDGRGESEYMKVLV